MSDAWKILAALTLARLCMGFQFQAIPALVGPLTAQGLSFAALGTLTGAYLLPGVAAALGGGWLGQRVGDIRTALWGLGLMTAGGFGGWLAETQSAALAWRLLAGVGAVGLNVMLSKMAGDWFQDRDDLPTAMGVLVSSWPAGIAAAMLALPPLAAGAGLGAALLVPPLLCAASLTMLARVWRAPPRRGTAVGGPPTAAWLTGRELLLVLLAGGIWGLYNVALIAAIAWTPGLLAANGVAPVAAAAAVSLIGWAAIVSVAAGGWLAARSPWRDLPPLGCFVLSAGALVALPAIGALSAAPWAMLGVGLLIGPPAAVIMTLPVEAARPQLRALAMGIFLAVYYGMMGVAPALLGALRDRTGDAAAPLYAAAALLGVCLLLWAEFRAVQRRGAAPPSGT